jgi:DNA invertase Pin-like site-specific DNA recombinase
LAEDPPGKNRRVVAFLKEDQDSLSSGQQLELIKDYCRDHGLTVSKTIISDGRACTSLEEAIRDLANADGLIISDLNRLVKHNERGYDLRPVLNEFIQAEFQKRLIAVMEGIDTRSASGQIAAMEIINQVKDPGGHEDWVPNTSRS